MTVLVVEHEAEAPLGRLDRDDLPVDVRRPYLGETLPPSLEGFAGLVVLGGEMNAYEDERYPWLPRTRDLIAQAVRAELPTLLVCLGHQLGAVALGGRVERSDHGAMWGPVPVGTTADAASDPLFSHLGDDAQVLHWNGDIVTDLPDGAVVLARDPRGGVQAVRYGPAAWGVQCHPEVDVDIVARWASSAHRDEEDPDAAGRADAAMDGLRRADDEIAAAWSGVLDEFTRLATRG